MTEGEDTFSCQELLLGPGEVRSLPQVRFTRPGFGPVHVLAWGRKGYQTPLFLVTNLELWEEPVIGIRNLSGLKPSFRTRKVAAFICTKVI